MMIVCLKLTMIAETDERCLNRHIRCYRDR